MATNFTSTTVASGDPALASDYNDLRKDVVRNAGDYEDAGGTADAITLAIDSSITVLTAGDKFRIKAASTNTGAVTINVNSIGATAVKKNVTYALVAGDIVANQIFEVVYDGTNFQMLTRNDHEDEFIFGEGADEDATISSNTSLTEDKYYNNLTIQDTFTLNPSGFKIFVAGTLTYEGTGKIALNGVAGGDGGNGTTGTNVGSAGSAGAAVGASGSLPPGEDGKAGGAGGQGDTGSANDRTSGGAGTAGDSAAKSVGSAGSAGGAGGSSTAGGGAAGAAGAQTGTVYNSPGDSIFNARFLADVAGGSVTPHTGSAGSGSGGGGGGGLGDGAAIGGAGGGGGGSGSTGGFIFVAARDIVTVNGNNFIEAIGGDGGNGGNGGDAPVDGAGGGGGGGAAGGAGGTVVLIYKTKTGTGTVSVAGGAAGAAGNGGAGIGSPGGNGNNGSAGNVGATGQVYEITV